MQIRSKIQRLSAITLLAFVINVLMPFYAASSPAAANIANILYANSSEAADKVLICTTQGRIWVSQDEYEAYFAGTGFDSSDIKNQNSALDADKSKQQPTPSPHLGCDLCFTSGQNSTAAIDSNLSLKSSVDLSLHNKQPSNYSVYIENKQSNYINLRGITRAPPAIA